MLVSGEGLLHACIPSTNVNMVWQEWKEKFVVTVREFISTRKIKGKLSPPWITVDILHIIQKKEAV